MVIADRGARGDGVDRELGHRAGAAGQPAAVAHHAGQRDRRRLGDGLRSGSWVQRGSPYPVELRERVLSRRSRNTGGRAALRQAGLAALLVLGLAATMSSMRTAWLVAPLISALMFVPATAETATAARWDHLDGIIVALLPARAAGDSLTVPQACRDDLEAVFINRGVLAARKDPLHWVVNVTRASENWDGTWASLWAAKSDFSDVHAADCRLAMWALDTGAYVWEPIFQLTPAPSPPVMPAPAPLSPTSTEVAPEPPPPQAPADPPAAETVAEPQQG